MRLGADDLSPAGVLEVAVDHAPVAVDPTGAARAEASRHAAGEIAARVPVYGRSAGANSSQADLAGDVAAHGLRLLRSHAGGIGDLVPAEQARAMLVVRANQILAAVLGLRPVYAQTLVDALNSGHVPQIHDACAVGTGDLTALSETALTLIGERFWAGGTGEPPAQLVLEAGDALAFVSSNALTIGQSVLAGARIGALLRATNMVAALSLLVVEGNLQAYVEQAQAGPPAPWAGGVARQVRRLLGRTPLTPARVQDPVGYRCFPQGYGAAMDASAALERVLRIEVNVAAENPLISADDSTAFHPGGFHGATLALTLDTLRLAVLQTAQLSTARLGTLVEPGFAGGRPFLAEGPEGRSGVMILECDSASALARLRHAADPASRGHAVLSRGVESHASFASQSAHQTLETISALRQVLGCELVAVVRALRRRATYPDPATPAGQAFDLLAAGLSAGDPDRALGDDVAHAGDLLGRLAVL